MYKQQKLYYKKILKMLKVLSPQNIIDIKNVFKNYSQEDDDINISIKQKRFSIHCY